jgi:predicted PurR-regulated permease PerM
MMRSEAYHWFARGIGLALGVGLIVLLAMGVAMAVRVVVLVFIAVLLASALEPLVDRLRARLPVGRGLTILLVYAVFFVAVLALAFLVIPGAIRQFDDLGRQLGPVLADARRWAETIEPRALSTSLTALINAFQQTVVPRAEPEVPDPDDVIAIGLTVADFAISVTAILAMVYFWLTGRARLQRFTMALLPENRREGTRDAWNEIEFRLGAWVRAQLILMGSIGIMTGIAYAVIGLEGAVLLAVIAALAEAIPLVGPALGAIPALVVAAATGQIETVLLVAVVYAAIQTIESNILVPIVMRNTVGVPPFLVVAGVLAGAAIGGVAGAIVAIPLVASVLVVLSRTQVRESAISLEPTNAEGPEVPLGEAPETHEAPSARPDTPADTDHWRTPH